MHAVSDRAEAVDHAHRRRVGQEVGEGHAASVGLELQPPAVGRCRPDQVVSQARARRRHRHRWDAIDLRELELDAPAPRQVVGEVAHPREKALAVLRREVTDLPLHQAAVGDDVQALAGADEAVLFADVADELRVATDDPPDVDHRAVAPLRHPLHGAGPGRRSRQGRAPLPVGDPRVGGGAAPVQAPGGEPAPARHQSLAVAAREARLEHEHGVRRTAPVPHRPHGDRTADLLVRHRDQHEVLGRLLAPGAERPQRADEGRQAALHVEGARALESVAAAPRRHRRQHGVEVADQEGRALPDPRPAGDQHRLGLAVDARLRVQLGDQAQAGELGAQALGNGVEPGAVAARRRDRAQPLEQVHRRRDHRLRQARRAHAHAPPPAPAGTTRRPRRSKTSPGSSTWVVRPWTPRASPPPARGARCTAAAAAS